MRAATVFALLCCVSSCNKVEEPASSPEPRATGTTRPGAASAGAPGAAGAAAEPAPSVAGASPPCVVPTPADAPPVAAPAENCPADPGPVPELPRGAVSFPGAPGAPRVSVEIARTDSHHARGLMYRTKLGANEGMLFSWPNQQPRTFWMRNTCIPLDMLFLAADGTIVGILEQVPVMNDAPRGVPCPAAHVLELNAGYCREHGIKAGMRVAFE